MGVLDLASVPLGLPHGARGFSTPPGLSLPDQDVAQHCSPRAQPHTSYTPHGYRHVHGRHATSMHMHGRSGEPMWPYLEAGMEAFASSSV